MPSSQVHTFTDPGDYAAAIRGSRAEVTILGRGQFRAKLTKIELHRLWMQRFFDNLPRVVRSANLAGRAIVSFRTQPGPSPSVLADGFEIPPAGIVRHSDPDDYHQTSSGFANFAAMSLPVTDMVSAGATLAEVDLTPPKDLLILTPPPAVMAKLQRLYAAAADLAEEAPEIIANADAARGVEQALIEAMVDCLACGVPREHSCAQGQHTIVMRRFRRLVKENLEQPPYPEIYATMRVSSRTLRLCCREHGNGAKELPCCYRMP